MQIKNKIVLITGASNGLGFAFAKELLRNGASHVAILDLEQTEGNEAVAKLNLDFGKNRAIFIPCDVSKPQQLEASFKETVDTFHALDIVINNAGVLNENNFDAMISVNVSAVIRGTLLAFQYMGKDKGGKGGVIVNIASIYGLQGGGFLPIYAATKHAVVGLSRSFASPYHYNRTSVRVLTMCPGLTETALNAITSENLLDEVETKYALSELFSLPSQKVENVAHGMIYIIRTALNGSVWVSEGDEPVYEVNIPDRLTLRVQRED